MISFTDEESFATKLATALQSAVNFYNQSKDPTDAVIKAAEENGFLPPGAKRLTEALNRTLSITHFSSSTDKTAEFELADPAEVLRRLYGAETSKIAENSCSDFTSLMESYALPERNLYDTTIQDTVVKAAEETLVSTFVSRHSARTQKFAREILLQAVKAAESTSSVALDTVDSLLDGLAKQLRNECTGDLSKLNQKLAFVVTAASTEPELGTVALKLSEYFPVGYINKQASYTFDSVLDTSSIESHLLVLKEASEALGIYAQSLAIKEAMEKELSSVASADYTRSIPKQAADGDPKKDKAPTFTSLITGNAPMKVDILRSMAGSDADVGAYKQTGKMLTNLHRELLLAKLLRRDPVLSNVDPNQVIAAYENLMRLSPEVANQPGTVASVLRSSVQTDALSPYDAEQLVKLNRGIAGGKPSADGDGKQE